MCFFFFKKNNCLQSKKKKKLISWLPVRLCLLSQTFLSFLRPAYRRGIKNYFFIFFFDVSFLSLFRFLFPSQLKMLLQSIVIQTYQCFYIVVVVFFLFVMFRRVFFSHTSDCGLVLFAILRVLIK